MSVVIKGGASTDLASVTTDKELQSRAALFSENSATADPAGRSLLSPETSLDYRLRVGTDQLIWFQTWENASNPNLYQNSYAFTSATQTQGLTAGYLQINASGTNTAAHYSSIASYRTAPMFGVFPTFCEFVARMTNETSTGKIAEMGLGIPPGAGVTTDGCVFRWDASGDLTCVVIANSVERASGIITKPTTNEFHRYTICVYPRSVQFWIDNALVATVAVPTARGCPANSYQGRVFWRIWYNVGGGTACKIDMAMAQVSLGDMASNRPWDVQMAGLGLHAMQTPVGSLASGQISTWANSAAPTAITALSNTALPTGPTHTNMLGGLFFLNLSALGASVIDGIMWAFPNPVATATSPGRTLYVTGVRIDGHIFTAGATGTATIINWGLGAGSTGISLATSEGVAAKAPRRLSVGQWFVPAAAGATAGLAFPVLTTDFSTAPVPIYAGEYCHIILKVNVALTAFTAGDIRGSVLVNGYFE